MNGFWKHASCTVVHGCLLVCVDIIHLFFRQNLSSQVTQGLGGYGSVTVKNIPRIHSEKRLRLHALLEGAAHDVIPTHLPSL